MSANDHAFYQNIITLLALLNHFTSNSILSAIDSHSFLSFTTNTTIKHDFHYSPSMYESPFLRFSYQMS